MPKINQGRVVLLHGAEYRKRDRGTNMRRLAPSFRAAGFCVIIPTYGLVPALLLGLLPWLDARIAEAMSGFIDSDDILVGHSNGATLAYLISKRLKVRGAVLVNAALNSNKCPDAGFIHVYYNAGDIITKLSQWIPFHPWGSMGGIGYTGPYSGRLRNINQGKPPEPWLPALNGHSAVFQIRNTRPWARYMAESCLQDVLALYPKEPSCFPISKPN